MEKKRGAIGVGDARRKVRSVRSIGTQDGGVVHEGRMAACNCRFVGVSSEVARSDVTATLAEEGKKLWPAPPFRGSDQRRLSLLMPLRLALMSTLMIL